MSFREVTIAALESEGAILAIQDGNHGEKHPKANDYIEDGIPFIMASNLRSGYVDIESANKLPQSISDRLRIGFCRGGDVLLSHKGSVGYVAIAPDHDPYLMLTPQVTYYRVNEEKLSREFLKFAFRDPMFQKQLSSAAGQQGTRGYVGIKAQRKLTVPFGDKAQQDRLVCAVKPYDDLIENNRRRIALLEEAARLLYREWFVHFRFPGHEHVKITDGLPEGWQWQKLGEISTVRKGKNITRNTAEEGDIPVVAGGLQPAYFHSKANVVGPAITISASGANAGYVALYHTNIWASDCSYLSVADNPEIWFLYLTIKSRQMEITGMQQGAAQPHVYPKHLQRLNIVYAPTRLRNLFGDYVDASFRQIANLKAQMNVLAQARDLLLPRLMNGEIAV